MRKGFNFMCALLAAAAILLFLISPLGAEEEKKEEEKKVEEKKAEEKKEEVYILKYSNLFPSGHRINDLSVEWCKEIEKRTKMRVRFNVYQHNALVSPADAYQAVVNGTVDVAQTTVAHNPGRFPLTEVLSLPLGYTSGRLATKTANAFYEKMQPQEFSDAKIMYFHGSPPSFFMTRGPVARVEDLRGQLIKGAGHTADIIALVGARSATIPISETYDALKKRQIDGVFFPEESLKSWKFSETIRSVLENRAFGNSATMFVVMNKAKFESMPEDIREIIEKVNRRYAKKMADEWDELTEESRKTGKLRGVHYVKPTKDDEAKWTLAVRPLFDKYLAAMKAKNLPGEEALQFCLDYVRRNR